MFGRPTAMVSNMIACRRPLRVDVPPGHNPDCLYCFLISSHDSNRVIVFPWKYSFTQLVCDVLLQSTHSATYADILKYEKKLRAHHKPSSLAWPPSDVPFPNEAVAKTFQRYIAVVWENACMYIASSIPIVFDYGVSRHVSPSAVIGRYASEVQRR